MWRSLLLIPLLYSSLLAACEEPIDLRIEWQGAFMEFTWNPHWTQSSWTLEMASTLDFSDAEPLATTSNPFYYWAFDNPASAALFFRVVAAESGDRPDVIPVETFEWPPQLHSFESDDLEPEAWEWSTNAFDGQQSLALTGHSAKALYLGGPALELSSTYRVAAYSEVVSDRQMVGFSDSLNVLWYVLWGEVGGYPDSPGQTGQVEISSYQGWFPTEEWAQFILPVGQDWQSKFGYPPAICEVIFSNQTEDDEGVFLVDCLEEISPLAIHRPACNPTWELLGQVGDSLSIRLTDLGQEESCQRFWHTGDGRSLPGESVEINVLAARDHRVVLEVIAEDGLQSFAHQVVPAAAGDYVRELRLGFTGDCMTARNYESNGGLIDLYGVDTLLANVRNEMQAVDLMSINLECPYTTVYEPHPTKSIIFRSHPDNLELFDRAGVDYCAMANNHVFDHMTEGMAESMTQLQNLGIANSGAGPNSWVARQPAFMSADGLSVGTLSFSDRTGHYNNAQPYLDAGPSRPGFAPWNRGIMQATIPQLAAQADLTVVQVHSGYEYSTAPVLALQDETSSAGAAWLAEEGIDPIAHGLLSRELLPNQSERSLRQEAIDLGADLVITHHPHILQGLELYEGGLIAHSLGNFLMDLSYVETMTTGMIEVEHGDEGLTEVLFRPAFLDRWVPRFATGYLAASICDHVAELSRPYGTWLLRAPGDEVGTLVLDTLAIQMETTIETHSVDLIDQTGIWESAPVALSQEAAISALRAQSAHAGLEVRIGRDILWWGTMEDEGATVWDINSSDEGFTNGEQWQGARSLWQQASPASSTNTYYIGRAPIDPARQHTLSGYIKNEAQGRANIQMRWYSSRNGSVIEEQVIGQLSGEQDWTQVWQDLDMPGAGDFYQVRVRTEADGLSNEAYFDDINLVEWEPWQSLETTDWQALPYPSSVRYIQLRSTFTGASVNVEVERSYPVPN
jgi:poly-gamma-glutamate capsule biosynthesis protein CapA/YwtB (metallophosphatase superfamily)